MGLDRTQQRRSQLGDHFDTSAHRQIANLDETGAPWPYRGARARSAPIRRIGFRSPALHNIFIFARARPSGFRENAFELPSVDSKRIPVDHRSARIQPPPAVMAKALVASEGDFRRTVGNGGGNSLERTRLWDPDFPVPTGKYRELGAFGTLRATSWGAKTRESAALRGKFPARPNREFSGANRDGFRAISDSVQPIRETAEQG